jgi:uncharacterized protein (DUF1330 family)
MPTYIVGDIHISDPATYQAHLPRALATIARFGGRVIAGGGKIDLLEGDPMPEGIFIIEFQTADAARRWYQSDEYQEALVVEQRGAVHGRVETADAAGTGADRISLFTETGCSKSVLFALSAANLIIELWQWST